MLKKALVSPLALAFGLGLTGAAAAQIMLGDQMVLDEDLPAVQEHCDRLALAASTASTDDDDVSVDVDETDNATTGVELTTITLQQCIDAGLIEGPVPGVTPSVNSGGGDDDGDDDTDDDNTDDDTDDDTTDDTDGDTTDDTDDDTTS